MTITFYAIIVLKRHSILLRFPFLEKQDRGERVVQPITSSSSNWKQYMVSWSLLYRYYPIQHFPHRGGCFMTSSVRSLGVVRWRSYEKSKWPVMSAPTQAPFQPQIIEITSELGWLIIWMNSWDVISLRRWYGSPSWKDARFVLNPPLRRKQIERDSKACSLCQTFTCSD